jgi:hypothetical protein
MDFPWISLDSLVWNETFQRVALTPLAEKSSSPAPGGRNTPRVIVQSTRWAGNPQFRSAILPPAMSVCRCDIASRMSTRIIIQLSLFRKKML